MLDVVINALQLLTYLILRITLFYGMGNQDIERLINLPKPYNFQVVELSYETSKYGSSGHTL